jgi:hypothetical protein
MQDPRQAQAAQNQQVRQKIEGIAATVFTEAMGRCHLIFDSNQTDEEWAELCQRVADRSIDASLVLGKNLWGIEGARQKPPQKPKRAPRVITDEVVPIPQQDGQEDQQEES